MASGASTWANAVKGTAPTGATTPAQRSTGQERIAAGKEGPSTCIDEDGFQQVVRKGRKPSTAADGGPGAQGDGRPSPMDTTDADDEGSRSGDIDAIGEQDGDTQAPTPADLQRAWRDEIALIKKLRSQGVQDGHPAMRAAIEARDAAEQAWRTSKDPAPQAVRLGRAQSKLDRAEVLQSEARAAIQEEERGHRERMATLRATLDECTERVTLRRRQVQEIQSEVGEAGGASSGLQRAQRAAIEEVHGTICKEVGPTLEALAEQVGTDTPAWATLNSLLAKLADSKATLENASAPTAENFHIGGEDDTWEEGTEWSESHDMEGQRWGQGNAQCVPSQREGQAHHSQAHDDRAGTTDWWGSAPRRWGAAARWQPSGHGHWSRASWADQCEDAMDDDDDGGGQPPTARRRVERQSGEDPQRRQATQTLQPPPPAAQESSASGSNDNAQERQNRHRERINRIIELAVESGVTPLTSSGEELYLLGPEQLEEWVAACLPAARLT